MAARPALTPIKPRNGSVDKLAPSKYRITMDLVPKPSAPSAGPSPGAAAALLARAQALAARQPALPGALKGKNIGLVCAAADSREALLFSAAAGALGAKVAHVRAKLSDASTPLEIAETARLLGRL